MKTKSLHILTCLLLMLLTGCRNEEPVGESQPEERMVNVSLGITTRADDVNTSDIPDVLYLWIFDGDDDSCLSFTQLDNPQFSGVDIQGNPVQTVDVQLLTTNGTQLKFYVVLNNVTDEDGSPVQFDASTSLASLENLQFTLGTYGSDNKVPMSGTADLTIESTSNDYLVEVPAGRAVAKLELFVTKNTPGSNLQITGITLSNNPETGILFRKEDFPPQIDGESSVSLIDNGIEINASLNEADAPGSDDLHLFEGDGSKLQKITLTNPYLLENPWGDKDIHLDDGSTSITDSRYYITLNYTLGGSPVSKKIYLTEIERNTLNKVFIRIKETVFDIEVSCVVTDWEDIEHEVQLSDKGTFEIGIPNIRQFPWDSKNYVATQYGEGAGAADRYATLTLRMTIPKGVKWQAHLDNPDFEFVGESDGVGVGENPQTPEEGVVTLRIRPVHTYTENERRTANLFVTLGTKPNEHALFITDADQQQKLCSDNGTEIRIIQVSSAEGDQIWTANP